MGHIKIANTLDKEFIVCDETDGMTKTKYTIKPDSEIYEIPISIDNTGKFPRIEIIIKRVTECSDS